MFYISNTKFIIAKRRFKEINYENYINNLANFTLSRKVDIKIKLLENYYTQSNRNKLSSVPFKIIIKI